jgi:hypothetical protein
VTLAIVTAWAPCSTVLGIGALVFFAHAASLVALAAGRPPLRRAEIADGLTAAAFAAVGAAVRPARPCPPGPAR